MSCMFAIGDLYAHHVVESASSFKEPSSLRHSGSAAGTLFCARMPSENCLPPSRALLASSSLLASARPIRFICKSARTIEGIPNNAPTNALAPSDPIPHHAASRFMSDGLCRNASDRASAPWSPIASFHVTSKRCNRRQFLNTVGPSTRQNPPPHRQPSDPHQQRSEPHTCNNDLNPNPKNGQTTLDNYQSR
eukprot:1683584-Rhodomonas_salina.1